MCQHQQIVLMGQIAVGQGQRPVELYSCTQCRTTLVLRNQMAVKADYRLFR